MILIRCNVLMMWNAIAASCFVTSFLSRVVCEDAADEEEEAEE